MVCYNKSRNTDLFILDFLLTLRILFSKLLLKNLMNYINQNFENLKIVSLYKDRLSALVCNAQQFRPKPAQTCSLKRRNVLW